jgi:hypothetical protein
MFKADLICPECGSELISLLKPKYGLCDDCIEDWQDRRDKVDPDKCIHGNLKNDCENCLTPWE